MEVEAYHFERLEQKRGVATPDKLEIVDEGNFGELVVFR